MINESIKGINLCFNTSAELFSPHCIDKGTLAMLSVVEFNSEDKLLDLGCGYGVVGILAAKIIGTDKVIMVDNNQKAVEQAKENAVLNSVGGIIIYQSDGFKGIKESEFTLILSNPPYHEDFSVPKHFIEKGFNRLVIGGKMFMVTKREKWYKNKLRAIFGGVKVWEIEGYFIFMAEKRSTSYANNQKNK